MPLAALVVMRENDEALTWLLTDQINSTTVTVSEAGTLVSEVKYTAFGEVRSINGVMVTDSRYTGQREEVEIGLYYYVARFYDPELAHFIQADTIIPSPGFALSYLRYAYVNFNPILYNDPDGHDTYMWGPGGGGSNKDFTFTTTTTTTTITSPFVISTTVTTKTTTVKSTKKVIKNESIRRISYNSSTGSLISTTNNTNGNGIEEALTWDFFNQNKISTSNDSEFSIGPNYFTEENGYRYYPIEEVDWKNVSWPKIATDVAGMIGDAATVLGAPVSEIPASIIEVYGLYLDFQEPGAEYENITKNFIGKLFPVFGSVLNYADIVKEINSHKYIIRYHYKIEDNYD
jgi:RHS repeat-associated protein